MVFCILQRFGFSNTVAGISTFALSGLLHAHVVVVGFDAGLSGALRALSFFLLHGAACALEKPLGWDR